MGGPVHAVHTTSAPSAIGPYSQGVVANGLLFAAGQIAIDPATGEVVGGDITVQTERVLRNLAAVLDAAGASGKDVVKTTVVLRHLNEFPAMNEAYGRVLGAARPARSTVEVAGLPRNVLVEIDLVATVDR
jgi:2-iminobutanoate/2-iminopropanoate deaminase